jgi:hypothetical protein
MGGSVGSHLFKEQKMRGSNKCRVLALLVALVACFAAVPAFAQLTITANFTAPDPSGQFTGSVPLDTSTLPAADTAAGETIAQAENTCNQAIAQITSGITTNTPVNITVNFLNDPNISLGASIGAGANPIAYSQYLPELAATATSPNDAKALASLAANPVATGTTITLGAANLLALGDTSDGNTLISGNSGLAGTVAFNFNLVDTSRSNFIAGQYDLLSTVTHEVDEILGIGGAGSTLGGGQTQPAATDLGAMDLYRYSASSMRTFSIVATGPAYFSIDGGVTPLVNFNQQAGGDFADWGDGILPADGEGNAPPQVQDAFGGDASVAIADMGPNEFTALDVIGYTPVTPEPASCALIAFGAIGLLARRRRAVNEQADNFFDIEGILQTSAAAMESFRLTGVLQRDRPVSTSI